MREFIEYPVSRTFQTWGFFSNLKEAICHDPAELMPRGKSCVYHHGDVSDSDGMPASNVRSFTFRHRPLFDYGLIE